MNHHGSTWVADESVLYDEEPEDSNAEDITRRTPRIATSAAAPTTRTAAASKKTGPKSTGGGYSYQGGRGVDKKPRKKRDDKDKPRKQPPACRASQGILRSFLGQVQPTETHAQTHGKPHHRWHLY